MNEAEPKTRRRWLRFSWRTLFVFVLLIGVVFGVLGSIPYEAKRQRKVVADDEGGKFAHATRRLRTEPLSDILPAVMDDLWAEILASKVKAALEKRAHWRKIHSQ